MTQKEALEYEVHSSWWAGWISNTYITDLTIKYFAWKVSRKYKRYKHNMAMKWWNEGCPDDIKPFLIKHARK